MKFENSSSKWLYEYLEIPIPNEGSEINLSGQKFIQSKGILRNQLLLSSSQAQTKESFGFKWNKRNSFDSEAFLARARSWLIERYGDIPSSDWVIEHGENNNIIVDRFY